MANAMTVEQAMQALVEALNAVDPQIPEGTPPWEVEDWVRLSQAWVGLHMLADYFGVGVEDEDTTEAEAAAPAPRRARKERAGGETRP